jgi:signal transduction histidine kinase
VTLRGKLLLAQLPLVVALLAVGIAGGLFLAQLGRSARSILEDNYRSVLAAQRMKESAERLDSAALFRVWGRPERAEEVAREHRRRFEAELRVQEGNVTEPGERDATQQLRAAWNDYLARYDEFLRRPAATDAGAEYFDVLLPAFLAVKSGADEILLMNQDAMVRKSERTERAAERFVALLVIAALAGFAIALWASASITGRFLRPLSVLAHATRRVGEGDLAARARIEGSDEVARLGADFNAMAERLQKYRDSTLGELLRAQRAAQAAIDSLADPVLVIGIGGALLHANRAAEDALGVTVERGLAALDPALREAVERARRHVGEGKGAFVPRGLDGAVRFVAAEGERHYLTRAAPVYADEGDLVGTTVILQDVTRLLRFEELRNNLVATVAHEFRTPLTSLRMAIHLLTEQRVGPLSEKQADLVYGAREDCERLQSTVDELLDISRIQAGRIELRAAPVEVEALVSDALEAQRVFAEQRHVALVSEVLPGIAYVRADVDRIQLVFANLLSNAVRHSPEGAAVSIRAFASEAQVRVEVVDHGPGIPKAYHQAIFEKYFQMPGAPAGGAGLGLFIAREIVQAHGGEIGVESEPGKGATFWFTLPRVAAGAPSA